MPRHDPQAGGRNTEMPGQRFDDGLVGLAVLGHLTNSHYIGVVTDLGDAGMPGARFGFDEEFQCAQGKPYCLTTTVQQLSCTDVRVLWSGI